MMQEKVLKGREFLERISAPDVGKDELFNALFDARGNGDNINTKHVFFQDVIIKFNASKAADVIKRNLPYETDSHYVDVVLYRYMQIGGNMKDFDRDLQEHKQAYERSKSFVPPLRTFADRTGMQI